MISYHVIFLEIFKRKLCSSMYVGNRKGSALRGSRISMIFRIGAGEREFRLWWGQTEPSGSSKRARNTCGRWPLRCYRIPADVTTRSRVALSARDGFDSVIESRFLIRQTLDPPLPRKDSFLTFVKNKILLLWMNSCTFMYVIVCVINLWKILSTYEREK